VTPDNDVEKLLGGFATNSLTDQERTKLFAAALTNQRLFDALADEQALKELLDDPRSRRLLIQALKEKQSKASRLEKLQAWFQQPWYQQPSSWAVAGGAVVALLAVTVVVHLVGLPTQVPQLTTDANPPVASAPDSHSPPKSGDLTNRPFPGQKLDPVTPPTERTQSPLKQPQSALTTPAGRMNKEESPSGASESTLPQAPASAPVTQPEKKQQEQYAGLEQPAPEPSLHKSFSGAADSEKTDANEMTADKQDPERKAKVREEVRRFSPMAGRAVTPEDTMKSQSPTPNIRYSVLREESEGTYSTVDAETTFQGGDRVRLALEPRDNGYLYVLTRDPTGNVKILFPPDGTGETARVEKMVRYLVPATGALTFETPIDHRVTILFSQKRLTDVRGLWHEETTSQKQTETDVVGGLAARDRDRSITQAPPAARSDAASVTRVEITLKHQ
jgi:Domain of unknown function (DUF4384)